MADLPIPMQRRIHFFNQVDQDSIGSVTKSILNINEDDERLIKLYDVYGIAYIPRPIEIYIDSYGGNVYQTFGLLSVMEKSKTPIHTYVTGVAMSCGFLMAIFGCRRFAYKYSTHMYHQVHGWSYGELKSMTEDVKQMKRLMKTIEKMTMERTRITRERIKQVYDTKLDWHITAQEALSLGIIDEIL